MEEKQIKLQYEIINNRIWSIIYNRVQKKVHKDNQQSLCLYSHIDSNGISISQGLFYA